MRIRRRQRRTISLIAVALFAGGVGVLAYSTHLLRGSEQQTLDTRFSIRGARKPPGNFVLVQIDNATLQDLTRAHLHSQFPFPRSYYAKVIDRLRAAGARAIALDLEFTHETDARNDNALIEAIGRAHGKTVLAATEVAPGGRTDVLGGPALLRELQARAAEARLTVDSDGAARRFAYAYNGLESFPVVTAEIASGRAIKASRFNGGTLPIDFAGPPGTVRSISFSKVLKGEFSPRLFGGKVAIVGASAPILQDVHTTATTGSGQMPGAEIWANASDTLLRDAPLKDAPGWLNIALILLLGVAVPLGSLRRRRMRALLDALGLAVVFSIAVQLAFNSGLIVSFVYPPLALALGTLGTLVILYIGEAIERERVRAVFSRFVPNGVVDEVLASADENLRLGGVERDCTVLFSDLRGFTSFSESQPAARVIDVVNCYLNEMTEAILDAGGTLISYMGDGIMAIFGAPLEQEDHADRAIVAARAMIGPRLDRFNAWLAEEGFDHSFAMGVGLNSGIVMAGNVGSEQRVEYTAIGDTTNTASRLEGMTKNSEAMLFVSESTRERMRSSTDELSFVGDVEIRGRVGTLGVWTFWPSGAGQDAEQDAEQQRPTERDAQ
ncbi:MAG: adenylate cyclase [Solirubrobacteraceae bacterium]|nr:adenylate cyclase [Solirubrobacteraceae bacterium]